MPKKGRYGSGNLWLRNEIWWVRYREVRRKPDGTTEYVQHCKSTKSSDRKYAERFLRNQLTAIGGRRPTVVDPEKVSYEDVRENFLAHCQEKNLRSLKRDKDGAVTLATLPRLDKFFGGWRAADITPPQLRRFRAECRNDGLSDARANRYIATIRAALKQAAKDELITTAELPSYFPMMKEPSKAQRALFIEPRWYAPLRQHLKEPLRSAFTLAYHFAIRVGELERLRWRDVDLKAHSVSLSADITKTGEPRIVPLPSDFDLKPGKPDELVFPLGDRREHWRTVCVKVGAGHYECRECGSLCQGRKCPTHGKLTSKKARYVGITLRHTRHTAVRNMVDAGMPRSRAKDISGHATDSIFNRYDIGRERDVEQARKTMERFHRKQQRAVR